MKSLKWALAAMSVSMLVACGGGGGSAGTSPFNSASGCSAASASAASGASSSCTSAATSVDVLASSVQVGSGGDTVTISATIKGAGNVGLISAPVTFSTNTGTLTGASTLTDSTGTAKATFSAGSDRSNRTATVTVTSGSAIGTIQLDIVGTTLSYSGATTVPLAGTSTVSVKAVDSKGAAIPGLTIAVTSSLSNGVSATSFTTDSLGTGSIVYTATNAGADTLMFAGAGASVSPTIQISAAQFTFLAPVASARIPVSTSRAVTVQYLSGGVPQAGQTINFAATAGVVTPISAVTNGAGQASVSISSATASPAVIQASVSGVAVQATVPVVFVAQVPARLILQVSPTAIGPNPVGATAQQAQLIATVVDANGNPVSGATVTFNRLADPSGGNLSQASAVTDTSGQATVQYIAGALTTPNNGVQVRASVLGSPAVFGDTQLTVNQSALFIALGTGNVIGNLDEQTYKKDWVVYVTDSNGVAVPNINLTIKVLPTDYRKGILLFQGGAWSYDLPTLQICANEDNVSAPASSPFNYNGILDPGEDLNGDGRLQPGNVIAVTTAQTPSAGATGIARTGSDGRATITLLYAESYVPWVKVKLVAQAIVAGTESSTEANFVVIGLASDFTNANIAPAGRISPFGTNSCFLPD